MEKKLKMGPVIIVLRDFPIYHQYPFYEWKLDPFCITEGEADITITYKKGAVTPEGEAIGVERSVYAHNSIYKMQDGSLLWQQTYRSHVQLQFLVSKDGKSIIVTEDNTNTFGIAVIESLTFLLFSLFLQKGVLSFHGAMVEYEGKGIIFSADSGVGKTTQARLWRDLRNAYVINGDKSSCYLSEGKWVGFGTPWCGTSGEYLNRQTPIEALVIVKRGTENRVRQLEGKKFLTTVLPHVLIPGWNMALTDRGLALLDDFLNNVKILEIECTPDKMAVDTLWNFLNGEAEN